MAPEREVATQIVAQARLLADEDAIAFAETEIGNLLRSVVNDEMQRQRNVLNAKDRAHSDELAMLRTERDAALGERDKLKNAQRAAVVSGEELMPRLEETA